MCSARLLATDPLFRKACGADPLSALAQRGLELTRAERKAFGRVWAMISRSIGDGASLPIELPNPDAWT